MLSQLQETCFSSYTVCITVVVGSFIYIGASDDSDTEDIAELVSPAFSAATDRGRCMSFRSHMHNEHLGDSGSMGSLKVIHRSEGENM